MNVLQSWQGGRCSIFAMQTGKSRSQNILHADTLKIRAYCPEKGAKGVTSGFFWVFAKNGNRFPCELAFSSLPKNGLNVPNFLELWNH